MNESRIIISQSHEITMIIAKNTCKVVEIENSVLKLSEIFKSMNDLATNEVNEGWSNYYIERSIFIQNEIKDLVQQAVKIQEESIELDEAVNFLKTELNN